MNKTPTIFLLSMMTAGSVGLISCDNSNQNNKHSTENSHVSEQQTKQKKIQATSELSSEDKALLAQAKIHFKSIKASSKSGEQIHLGKMLYFEPRLSKSGSLSCNSCHNLATFGVDNRSTSIGHGFKTGGRNSPTVLNSNLNFTQFWDGRAKDLAAQAEGPILNPIEMAMPDEKSVVSRLESIPEYVEAFKKAFPNDEKSLSYKNMAKAIARFEETLSTPSRFDKFLEGQGDALNALEKKGLKSFINNGCIACHNGAGIGGGSYQKFGAVKPYQFQKDEGRFEVTKKEEDKYLFKVPLLRNITKTYPYFHDGKVWDLKEAVQIMGKTQLGKDISDDDARDIVAFLDSLTGDIPEEARTLPVLPASSSNTSKPEI